MAHALRTPKWLKALSASPFKRKTGGGIHCCRLLNVRSFVLEVRPG